MMLSRPAGSDQRGRLRRGALPGKIVWDEAPGYMRFGFDYVKGKFQIPKMPPLREIMRPFH